MFVALWGIDVGGQLDLGDLVIAGTAGFAAWLAAHTANKRQAVQLDGEWRRQKQLLDHDRRMRDRDELRTVLDETTQELHSAIQPLVKASGLSKLATIETDTDEQQSQLRRMSQHIEEARQTMALLGPSNARLKMRLPDDDPIVRTHWAARNALTPFIAEITLRHADAEEAVDEIREILPEEEEANIRDQIRESKTNPDTAWNGLIAARRAFIEACRAQFA